MAKRDYYEVLGVERTADEAAIKAAYRKLAKKLHPDVNPGDKDAEEKFKEVNEAYQVLSDPQKRAQYDRFGHQQPGAGGAGGYGDFSGFGGFGGFDVEDIFSSFFGGGFGGGRARREQGPVPGADLRYDIAISFEEAAKGCDKEINLVRDETCETCKGTGAKPGTQPKTCPTCNGTGQVRTTSNTPFGAIQNVRTCPNCKHAAAQMDQAGIAYEELLAEENVELAQRFRIMQAPTLLEVAADGTVGITAGAAAVFQKINALRAQVVA